MAAALVFLALPLTTTFNKFLTRVVISVRAYRYIEMYIAPQIARMAAASLKVVFGLNVGATGPLLAVEAGGRTLSALIIWNCNLFLASVPAHAKIKTAGTILSVPLEYHVCIRLAMR